ncbi:MAG TPA: DUF58 domain-containing protein [Verrucomicrobiae bacterium]
MQPLAPRPQLTSLLANNVLDRLERLRIRPVSRRTSRSRGEHLSGKGGTSTEFCDYRDYVPGDDTRFVDWNIFARLHRPYLKQFHKEEERHVVLLIDASASMKFDGKLDLGKQLAAAFGMMGLLNNERVSIYASHQAGDSPDRQPPCRGRASLRTVFQFIEGIDGRGDAPLDRAVELLLRHHSGRGVCVILSDFLTFGDLKRSFNLLYSSGLEPFGIQILSPREIDPDLASDLRLVDSETQDTLDISTSTDLLNLYQEYRQGLEHELELLCRRRSGQFLSVSSTTPVESVLFDQLRRQGWLE